MLKAVLFDLDHTLIDWDHASSWHEYHISRMQAILDFMSRTGHTVNGTTPELLFESLAQLLTAAWDASRTTFIAPNMPRIIISALATAGLPTAHLDANTIMDAYDWQAREGEIAFPDVPEVLPQLAASGVTLGIVTNASQPMRYRDRELFALDLLDWFPDCRIAAVDVGYVKPHRAIFEHALELVGAEPHEVVFVGDNLYADIKGAQGAGIRGVWRETERKESLNDTTIIPDGTITTLHDLLPLLDTLYPGWRNGHTT
ncbi:MAG: HAD family hydrolase [Anaerolineae bacterium]|nr:HAD family hydrolase [Anaerolineae bacterium]